MARKAAKKAETKTKTVTAPAVEPAEPKTGTVTGLYSESVYNNGELISFNIDWDKLKEHVGKVG